VAESDAAIHAEGEGSCVTKLKCICRRRALEVGTQTEPSCGHSGVSVWARRTRVQIATLC